MILDHERLDVYRLALDFLVFAHEVIERLPRGRSHLCDQLTRASTSIVLNLAEGAGKHFEGGQAPLLRFGTRVGHRVGSLARRAFAPRAA